MTEVAAATGALLSKGDANLARAPWPMQDAVAGRPVDLEQVAEHGLAIPEDLAGDMRYLVVLRVVPKLERSGGWPSIAQRGRTPGWPCA